MKRGTWIGLFAALAVIGGAAWLILALKIEVRLQPYADDPARAPPPVDPVLQWIGWGLLGLFLAAVAFTAWAVVKQILLIRRGRPDSR